MARESVHFEVRSAQHVARVGEDIAAPSRPRIFLADDAGLALLPDLITHVILLDAFDFEDQNEVVYSLHREIHFK